MKKLSFLAFFLVSILGLAKPPHLELDLSAEQYQMLLAEKGMDEEVPEGNKLSPVIEMGKRSLEWLTYINKFRIPATQVSFTSVENQPAYPLENPRISNPTLILEEFNNLKATMPKWFYAVIVENSAFTENPPAPDAEYKEWGMLINKNYERAARWMLQEAYLSEYAQERKNDLRGYYFLGKEKDLQTKLEGWETLEVAQKAQLEKWMVGICYANEVAESKCLSELKDLYSTPKKLYGFYSKYLPKAQELWDSFFFLGGVRKDILWKEKDLAVIPMIDPKENIVTEYLKKNIEEEWQWLGWHLRLNIGEGDPDETAHVVFKAGVTPNVNGLAGNQITMDKNAPLTEFNVQWTIRHEFGHVLGFPDCYIEFYDDREKVMISYQLDISDLMCSRRGKLKQRHFDEMKKNYFKPKGSSQVSYLPIPSF